MKNLIGSHTGVDLEVGIVIADFNSDITSRLLKGSIAALQDNGVLADNISQVHVPGSFEISLVATEMAKSGNFSVIICLGAVIRGETDHYEIVAREVARGISDASIMSGIPVIFGVLTVDTIEQAINRSGGLDEKYIEKPIPTNKIYSNNQKDENDKGNIGYSVGLTAIEMANLMKIL
tara:strand:- start:615 stop:1148 length:534 start_codon:yes stop_codon:yes gene_type:complete